MNWEAIGAIGEIIGATAVVTSLVYLAVQIRTQNRKSRMSTMHDISVGYRDSLAAMAERDMADLYAKAFDDYESLTQPETIRLIAGTGRLFRVWEAALFDGVDGMIPSFSRSRRKSGIVLSKMGRLISL